MAKKTKAKVKKTKNKYVTSSKILAYIAWGLASIIVVLSSFILGYSIGHENAIEEIAKQNSTEKKERLELLTKLEKSIKEEPQKDVNKRLQEVLKKETTKREIVKKKAIKKEPKKTKQYISASHEIDNTSLAHVPKRLKRDIKVSTGKPRLSIIIDDVATQSQVNAIKSLQLPLTMSFLPPSKIRPHTPDLAAHENNYMVHLPMEALKWNAEEPFTLHTKDSQAYILQRIKKIKELFPKVAYINNHTGSKFTSDEVSMNRLIYALNVNNITFVDSRTTALTKAPKVLENFGKKYIARDVFLDHHMDKAYVLEQIRKSIKLAKRHGTAIAIGHPHKNTLKALYESKKLLKDVELVYINKLY